MTTSYVEESGWQHHHVTLQRFATISQLQFQCQRKKIMISMGTITFSHLIQSDLFSFRFWATNTPTCTTNRGRWYHEGCFNAGRQVWTIHNTNTKIDKMIKINQNLRLSPFETSFWIIFVTFYIFFILEYKEAAPWATATTTAYFFLSVPHYSICSVKNKTEQKTKKNTETLLDLVGRLPLVFKYKWYTIDTNSL